MLDRIGQLWDILGQDAGNYLMANNGNLDEAHYRDLFMRRVEPDLALADDEEFRNRYFNGYEVMYLLISPSLTAHRQPSRKAVDMTTGGVSQALSDQASEPRPPLAR